MNRFHGLIAVAWLLAACAQDAAPPAASPPTAPAAPPTATIVKPTADPAQIDLVAVFESTQLPPGATGGKAIHTGNLKGISPQTAEKQWASPTLRGLANIVVYATGAEASAAYAGFERAQPQAETVAEVGEQAIIAVISPQETIVFRRCQAVAFLLGSESGDPELLAYAQRLDRQLQAALCP